MTKDAFELVLGFRGLAHAGLQVAGSHLKRRPREKIAVGGATQHSSQRSALCIPRLRGEENRRLEALNSMDGRALIVTLGS
jgi:hypothetical protein